jgi:hypothetical protein
MKALRRHPGFDSISRRPTSETRPLYGINGTPDPPISRTFRNIEDIEHGLHRQNGNDRDVGRVHGVVFPGLRVATEGGPGMR